MYFYHSFCLFTNAAANQCFLCGRRLADYIEHEPARLAAKAEAQKQKLEALERKLGIDPSANASSSSTSTPGAGSSKDAADPVGQLAGKKHRFDDTEYLEKTQELTENVKSAVTAALLMKKRKKAKLAHGDDAGSAAADGKGKAKGASETNEGVEMKAKAEAVKPVVVPAIPSSGLLDAVGA